MSLNVSERNQDPLIPSFDKYNGTFSYDTEYRTMFESARNEIVTFLMTFVDTVYGVGLL